MRITIALDRLFGLKFNRDGFTILARVNASGTELIDPFVVGRANEAEFFGGLRLAEYRFDYKPIKEAYMNKHIFFYSVIRFDVSSSRRRTVWFIDNYSAHRKEHTLPPLTHTYLIFLPKNYTSRQQP